MLGKGGRRRQDLDGPLESVQYTGIAFHQACQEGLSRAKKPWLARCTVSETGPQFLSDVLRSKVIVGVMRRLNTSMPQEVRSRFQQKVIVSQPNGDPRVSEEMRSESNPRFLA